MRDEGWLEHTSLTPEMIFYLSPQDHTEWTILDQRETERAPSQKESSTQSLQSFQRVR
jgi:hypothetical protein